MSGGCLNSVLTIFVDTHAIAFQHILSSSSTVKIPLGKYIRTGVEAKATLERWTNSSPSPSSNQESKFRASFSLLYGNPRPENDKTKSREN